MSRSNLEHPCDVLRRAAEIIGSPYRCNSDAQHNQAQADLLNYVAGIWTDTAMPPRGRSDNNPYPVRRKIQEHALALANAIVTPTDPAKETDHV